jgi:hypothetical protein
VRHKKGLSYWAGPFFVCVCRGARVLALALLQNLPARSQNLAFAKSCDLRKAVGEAI